MMLLESIDVNHDFLVQFEAALNPLMPARSRTPARVLGYGEMSTVMMITGGDPRLVYKRMPMFHSEAEVAPYRDLYHAYLERLAAAGVAVVPAAITHVVPERGNVVVYIVQAKLEATSLANKVIHQLPAPDVERLFAAILQGIGRVFAYNDAHAGEAALGFDAQMSNWAIIGHNAAAGLREPVELIYIDTSSPLLRLDGVEQLDPELFLRSAPSFLRWVIRLLFLKDVMNRYYDRRQVVVDVLANLYKEKRDDMIMTLLVTANTFLAESVDDAIFNPITEKEVAGYYKDDARIWRVYLAFRRLDRWLHRVLGQPYPYILPGYIAR